jgi:2-polyprenyl-3-methyl-5-hydroxy-6-metoxy-1,4-benzoquinol methylase
MLPAVVAEGEREVDIGEHNRRAWDRAVAEACPWTVPVGGDEIAEARSGRWSIRLTPCRAVPRAWLPDPLAGVKLLALAGGGGQQGPILAAAGAAVTVLDASAEQLGQDRRVAERCGLALRLMQGDMRDLSALPAGSFDVVVHPVANMFVPEPRPVWRAAARVLRPGGLLLAGFVNPLYFLFDDDALARGELVVRYRIPYADTAQLGAAKLDSHLALERPLCFGHSLEDQLGGQLEAGFVLTDLYEDRYPARPLDDRIATFVATRAVRVRR